MRISEISYSGQPPVEGYGPHHFRIDGRQIDGAAAITAGGARPWGGYDDHDFGGGLDLLILGTGADLTRVPEGFVAALEACGIAVEAMATPVACRTYNMLLAEARRVALAVLPVGD